MNEKKVGIVMLSYNRADVTTLCLNSLARAKVNVLYELFVLDNASRMDEYNILREVFDKLSSSGSFIGTLERSEVNTGFPKGNNIGISRFLKRDDITHICLLNNDVILTDYWLDRLLDRNVDAIGPVTNACGNEQTIPVPFSLRIDDGGSLGIVKAFAKKRWELFEGAVEKTDWLGFFCFVATKELFESVGLLDERFGRGGFEDDDYCIRLSDMGFEMFVARDVFIYHWGTASFTQIPLPKLMKHIESNKRLFEEKYGHEWKDRKWLPLVSFQQDMDYLLRTESDREKRYVFDLYFSNAVQLAKNIVTAERKSAGTDRVSHKIIQGIDSRLLFRIFRKSMKLLFSRKNVVLLVRYPKSDDLKDGYFQRISAIDSILKDRNRFYVDYCRIPLSMPRVIKIKEGVWEVRLSEKNPAHLLFLFLLVILSGRIYLHSILRLRSWFHRMLFLVARKRILDVHGVVPEEFRFHDDERGYLEFNRIERFAVGHATRVICVTESMAAHIREKYRLLTSDQCLVTLPIFPDAEEIAGHPLHREKSKSVIYCGGLQKWQQVEKMFEYVRKHVSDMRFTFLVPDPDRLKDHYQELYGEKFPGMALSVPADEVHRYYREHRFGLVLREDVVVNRVACPTKLTEYLQHDIVPIVDLEEIGDFMSLGYRHVRYDDRLPDEAEWMEMAQENRAVLEKLRKKYQDGANRLRAAL